MRNVKEPHCHADADTDADLGGEMRVRAVVTGMVQGVGYRYFAVTAARRLGVTGWVRNRRDGSVEVEAQGEPDNIRSFVATLGDGPQWSRVDDVSVTNRPVQSSTRSSTFQVRPDSR